MRNRLVPYFFVTPAMLLLITFGILPIAVAAVISTTNMNISAFASWNNVDFVDHTATARDGSWDVVIATGKTAQVVMNKAGVVEYFCRFHPNMTAKIEVLDR